MYAILFRHKKCTFDRCEDACERLLRRETKTQKCDCIHVCGVRFIGNVSIARESKSKLCIEYGIRLETGAFFPFRLHVCVRMWPMGY